MSIEFSTIIDNKFYTFNGIGATNYTIREKGLFAVRTINGMQFFEELGQAFLQYIRFDEIAELLDITDEETVIESKEVKILL